MGNASKFGSRGSVEALVPDTHCLEFFRCDDYLVEFFKTIAFFVHHSQHPHTVPGNLLDGVAEQVKTFKVPEFAKFLGLAEVFDVVVVQVQVLEIRELQDFFVNCDQIVV